MTDPTAIPMQQDPEHRRFRGTAYHGNTPFDVPYVSKVVGWLYQGGCETGLVLPGYIVHLVSLYPWERYKIRTPIWSELYVQMYDSVDGLPTVEEMIFLGNYVNARRADGPTLVHCQAGLNRSSLVVGTALILDGMPPADAIELIRRRSPACLCNPAFEQFLLELQP